MWPLTLGFAVGLSAASIVFWCITQLTFKKSARAAIQSEAAPHTHPSKLSGRLSECEQLLAEVIAQLGRIEARDRMRKVRAAKDAPQTEPEPENVALTTAELRRKLALRKPTGVP